jgi:hypothetical protein
MLVINRVMRVGFMESGECIYLLRTYRLLKRGLLYGVNDVMELVGYLIN